MARETTLWTWLKKAGRSGSGLSVDKLQMERIENMCAADYPDVEGCYRGRQFHIELKSVKRPAKASTPVRIPHLTEGQVDWHKRRYLAGGNSHFVIQVGHGHSRVVYVFPGLFGEKLAEGQTEEWYHRTSWARGLNFGKCPTPAEVIVAVCRR